MIKINIVIPSKYAEESNTSVISSILRISMHWMDSLYDSILSNTMTDIALRIDFLAMILGRNLLQDNTDHFIYHYSMNDILESITLSYIDSDIRENGMFEVFIDFNPKIDNILRTIEIT
jgi:hypothetical protein